MIVRALTLAGLAFCATLLGFGPVAAQTYGQCLSSCVTTCISTNGPGSGPACQASCQASCSATQSVIDATNELITSSHGGFSTTRGALTANMPSFSPGGSAPDDNGGATASTFDIELQNSVELWIGGALTDFETDLNGLLSDGDARLVQGGVDIRFGEGAQIGLMAAGEGIESSINTAAGAVEADGKGYLVGPYVILGVAEGVAFEGSALGGAFSSKYKAPGGGTAKFESNRMLLSAGLSGDLGEGSWSLRPSVRATYYAEGQEKLTDPNGNALDVDTVSLGQLRLAQEIGYWFQAGHGLQLRPVVGAEGVWSFHQSDVTVNNLNAAFDELSAGVSLGLGAAFGRSALSLRGRIDGIGSSQFEAHSAEAQLRIKLN